MKKEIRYNIYGKNRREISWPTGPRLERFFTALKEEKKILGIRCQKCSMVYMPPSDFCARCYQDLTEWVEVKDEGHLLSYTWVFSPFPGQPQEPPYALGLIRLDGADTSMIHLLWLKGGIMSGPRCGVRVKAVWNDIRQGTIRDIRHFEIMEV